MQSDLHVYSLLSVNLFAFVQVSPLLHESVRSFAILSLGLLRFFGINSIIIKNNNYGENSGFHGREPNWNEFFCLFVLFLFFIVEFHRSRQLLLKQEQLSTVDYGGMISNAFGEILWRCIEHDTSVAE